MFVRALLGLVLMLATTCDAKPLRIIAFGDSLTAGYLLPAQASFPSKLEKALKERGWDVEIINAGVSGDTTSGGLERLEWTISEGADGFILELGANDMLRGLEPKLVRQNLDAILKNLEARRITVLVAGMLASPTFGASYRTNFDRIYPELAAQYKARLYPFFLEGVMGDSSLVMADGLHPNANGIDKIVSGILPSVEAMLKDIKR